MMKSSVLLYYSYNWIPIPDVWNSNFRYQSTNPMRDISRNSMWSFSGCSEETFCFIRFIYKPQI